MLHLEKKGEIMTILVLVTMVVIGISSFASSVVLKNKQTTKSKAKEIEDQFSFDDMLPLYKILINPIPESVNPDIYQNPNTDNNDNSQDQNNSNQEQNSSSQNQNDNPKNQVGSSGQGGKDACSICQNNQCVANPNAFSDCEGGCVSNSECGGVDTAGQPCVCDDTGLWIGNCGDKLGALCSQALKDEYENQQSSSGGGEGVNSGGGLASPTIVLSPTKTPQVPTVTRIPIPTVTRVPTFTPAPKGAFCSNPGRLIGDSSNYQWCGQDGIVRELTDEEKRKYNRPTESPQPTSTPVPPTLVPWRPGATLAVPTSVIPSPTKGPEIENNSCNYTDCDEIRTMFGKGCNTQDYFGCIQKSMPIPTIIPTKNPAEKFFDDLGKGINQFMNPPTPTPTPPAQSQNNYTFCLGLEIKTPSIACPVCGIYPPGQGKSQCIEKNCMGKTCIGLPF